MSSPSTAPMPTTTTTSTTLTAGQLVAERLVQRVGSWPFIIGQATFLLFWFGWNVLTPHALHYDNYPFIFCNLAMSMEAAFATPIILIASVVQAIRDRNESETIRLRDEAMVNQLLNQETNLLLEIKQMRADFTDRLATLQESLVSSRSRTTS